MTTSAKIRVIRFQDVASFVEAAKQFDDPFMNFCLGPLIAESLADPKEDADADTSQVFLFGVFQEHDLLLCLTKDDFAWKLSIPCTASTTMASANVLTSAAGLLAAAVPDTVSFDRIIGPEPVTNAFVDARCAHLAAHGAPVPHFAPTRWSSRVSYVTRASLPPPPPPESPPACTVALARPEDLDALVPFCIGFRAESPWRHVTSPEEARAILAGRVAYVARVGGAPAGYVLMGRATPRTLTIGCVYVAPEFRRRGVAEVMVRAVTRYYLGVDAHGVEGVPEGAPPEVGVKEAVTLNVASASAEGVYRRAGFLFPEGEGDERTGGVDPVTGRKAWFVSIWRETVKGNEA